MICKKCGADVPEGGAFCTACGAAVEKEEEGVRCKHCGAVIPEGAAFCMACGTAREKQPEVVHCAKCGAVIPEGGAFCTACGTAREKQPEVVHCANCGAVMPEGGMFCTACGTAKGAAGPVAQAPVSAPPTAKKNAAQTMDKTNRLLTRVAMACVVLGVLLSWVGSSVSDAGPSDYESLMEFSNTVAMYNGLSLLLCLVGGVLGVIIFIREKKNKGKQ